MSTARKPVPHDPSGWITDGQETVGYLFDTRDGTVATLGDRMPLGTFATWAEARRVIFEARKTSIATAAEATTYNTEPDPRLRATIDVEPAP